MQMRRRFNSILHWVQREIFFRKGDMGNTSYGIPDCVSRKNYAILPAGQNGFFLASIIRDHVGLHCSYNGSYNNV